MKRTLKKREEKERERERVEKGARRKKNGWKESEVAGRILGEIILGSARAIWSRANANSEHNRIIRNSLQNNPPRHFVIGRGYTETRRPCDVPREESAKTTAHT